MGPFSPHSASGVATRATKPHHVMHLHRPFSIDRSSLTGRQTVLSPSQENTSALSSTYADPAQMSPLDPTDPTPAPSAGTVGMQHATVPEINLRNVLYILTTPYDPVAWKNALEQCNITPEFPNLVDDIIHGSSIGNPPPLNMTFLLRNLPSTFLYPHLIDKELLEETSANRMSGPFTISQGNPGCALPWW